MDQYTGIYRRGNRLWMTLRLGQGRRMQKPTPYNVGQERQAAAARRLVQEQINAGQDVHSVVGNPTVKSFAKRFLEDRVALGVRSAHDDESRLRTHVFPLFGSMRLDEVETRHIAEMVKAVRNNNLAPRTVRNIYSVVRALFRDAQIAGLVQANPCILTHFQLGKVRDAKKGWRAGALFSREELQALISDRRVPQDRRVLYALAGLAALRHGEVAGLRWRQVVTGLNPLGRLVILTSYDRGDTKTGVERWMPAHPVLAAMLAEWKMRGWTQQQRRAPGPDDLVVPHPQPTNRGPRVKFGGMRTDHDSYKRLRIDLDTLGFRRRRFHDLRRTFITLAREDGAEKDILRLCTHGAGDHDVMELYTSFGWKKLCDQVSCIRVRRDRKIAQ